jgi:predicted nucleic acid-binding protein
VSTLVDSNVLLDVIEDEDEWTDWSASMLRQAAEQGPLVINPIVYAEICFGYDTIERLEHALPSEFCRREALPWAAAFLASRAFIAYRRRGGVRRSPLPDFYIGAHAAIAGYTLLTRDPKRYRTYFPKLRIIAP